MRIVAIIPARGGSKGLPRKNCQPLLGKPLVAYSIEAALGCPLVDAAFVSTEDAEIAGIARGCGALVVERPLALAGDAAQNDAVCRHAVEQLRASGPDPQILVLLQPTSPLRSAAHLQACLTAFDAGAARSAMSVCRVEHHLGKCMRIEDGRLAPFTTLADVEARRQDMVEVYRQNGAIYVVRVPEFLASGRFYLPPCQPFVMEAVDSVDIDDVVDLTVAEAMLRRRAAAATS